MADETVPAAELDWDDVEFSERPHTQIHRRCGGCQQPFNDYERMIASTHNIFYFLAFSISFFSFPFFLL